MASSCWVYSHWEPPDLSDRGACKSPLRGGVIHDFFIVSSHICLPVLRDTGDSSIAPLEPIPQFAGVLFISVQATFHLLLFPSQSWSFSVFGWAAVILLFRASFDFFVSPTTFIISDHSIFFLDADAFLYSAIIVPLNSLNGLLGWH